MDETIRRLEEKIAYLEHHVTAQDKVMLEMGEELRRLRADFRLLMERLANASSGDRGPEPQDERPPHY